MTSKVHALRGIGAVTKFLAAVLALVFVCAPAASQTRITLEDAINIALERNIELRKADNQVELSERTVLREKGDFLPNLSASASAGRNWGLSFDQTSGRLVSEKSDNVSTGVNSSVNVFNGFDDIASLRGAQFRLESDELTRERTEQDVFFSVIQAYLQILLSQEQIGILEENLESQRQQFLRIQEFTRLGARPISDQYQQQALVATAELSLLDAEQALDLNESRLLQFLELDPLQEYEFDRIDAETLPIDPSTYDLDAMMSESLNRRADVRARQFFIRALEQDIRSAKSGRLPSLNLSGNIGTSYSSQRVEVIRDEEGNIISSDTVPFGDQFSDNRSGRVGFSLSIPLFSRFATRTNVHRSKITYENALLDLENLEQTVALEVRQAYLDYQSALKRIDVTEIQLQASQQAERVEQERYNLGASTLVELTQARAALVDAESTRAQAIYQFIFQTKVIDYYLGVLQPTDTVLPQ
jgi:outer membrane protein